MNWLLKNGKSVEMQKTVYEKVIDGFNHCFGKIELIELWKKRFISKFLGNTHADIFIVEFALEELDIAEIFEWVEKYKSEDGQYVLEGTFRCREFVEEYVKRDVKRLIAKFHYVAPQSGGVK